MTKVFVEQSLALPGSANYVVSAWYCHVPFLSNIETQVTYSYYCATDFEY